jgi:hypothetical protein
MTFISSSKSDNQAKSGKRLNKKPPLDSLPIISPKLISKAAAIARRRARLQSRLDCLTVFNLIAFAYQINHTLSELEHMPVHNGYVTGKHYGRTYHFSPANWFYTKTEYSIFRLCTLLNQHKSTLSQQAAIAIEEALMWHKDKCREMWEAREGLAALAGH